MKKHLIIVSSFLLFTLPGICQTLEEYFNIAAENNPGLHARYKRFEAAMTRTRQVTSLPDPTLSFGYFISPIETRVGPQRARFSLTQMFPWFGTLQAKGDVAALNAEVHYQAFLDEQNKLYYQVAASYYPLYELDRWIDLEEENVDILESYKTIATTKFENGVGTLVDVLRVDLMLKDSQTNLEILREKRKPLQTAFNNLLNRSEDAAVELEDSLLISEIQISRDSLFTNNPVLTELDLRGRASELQEELAQKQGLPSFGLGLDYMIVGKRTDLATGVPAPENNGRNALMPMVTVGIPIFQGKHQAAREEARLMQESYELQKESRINELVSDYEMVSFERSRQLNLINLYDLQISETQQVLNLLLTSYGNSGQEFEEVLRVQQQLLKYKKLKASSLTKHQIAVARLDYLTAK